MSTSKTILTICVLAGAAVVLAACDSSEQRVPLSYEKGVYLGKPDAPLSEETLSALRERAAYQGGFVNASSGGFMAADETAAGSDVRPPGVPRDGN